MSRGLTSALVAGAALVVACSSGEGSDGDASDARKNVVLVVIDTLRVDRTSRVGHERETMPRLAAFAAQSGHVFDNARSTSSWTKPSVASIFTGLDPRAHGVTTHLDGLHTLHRTLAEAFAEAGYATVGVQSNPYLVGVSGMAQGFEAYADGTKNDPTIATHERSTGKRVNEVALLELDRLAGQGRPFFLYVHHYEPHHAYLRDELVPEGAFGIDAVQQRRLAQASMDQLLDVLGRGLLGEHEVRYLAARYDSDVLHQDELLGELLDGIRARGLLADTILAITADHGEEFLEHGDLSHKNDKLFDELLRVPLVLSGPGIEPGRSGLPVSLAHLGRTLLDLGGVPGAAFPGPSLAPLFAGQVRSLPVVAHGTVPHDDGTRTELDATVIGKWKLVRDLVGGETWLFDLSTDAAERIDVGDDNAAARGQLLEFANAFAAGEAAPRELPPEDPEVLRERATWLEENESLFHSLGYTGDPEDTGE